MYLGFDLGFLLECLHECHQCLGWVSVWKLDLDTVLFLWALEEIRAYFYDFKELYSLLVNLIQFLSQYL